jgi:hypothetical protein
MTKQNTNNYIRPTLKQSLMSVLYPIKKSIKKIDSETRKSLHIKNIEYNQIEKNKQKNKKKIYIIKLT